jgi:imidazolonepropionase-like amidohydrolase
MPTTVIRSGAVVTGDGRTVAAATDAVIVDGRIRDLLPAGADRSYEQADRVLDAAGKLVLPGVINNHSHGTAFGPLFPSGHQGLPAEQVLANLDRHLREGTTTLLCVDGFVTAEQLAATRERHPINIGLASCNTPACLRAAQIADGGGLTDRNREFTAGAAAAEGAVAFGEIGAGHTLGGGGASYMYIPAAIRERTGKEITPAQANALKYAVLGRHIDAAGYDAEAVAAAIERAGLTGLLRPEDVAEIISGIVLPPFEVALRGLAEAGEYGRRHDLPVLVHNAAASMKQVAEVAATDVRLIAGHSNHDSFTFTEALDHARTLRRLGAVVDVSTLDCFGARRLVDSPELTFSMLREGLVDTISTDYAAGFHDPILLGVSEAVKHGAVGLAPAIAMATANVADAIPGLAPNRGRIQPGAVADVVITDPDEPNRVDTVLVGGNVVVEGGETVWR